MREDNHHRLKALRAISNAVRSARAGVVSPAFTKAGFTAVAGGVAGYFIGKQLAWPVVAMLLFAISGFAFVAARAKYKTWNAYFYDLLAEYQPINKEAYQHLQELARLNSLNAEEILAWIRTERDTILPPKETELSRAKQRFLCK